MNRIAVAQELVRVAQLLGAAKDMQHGFTVKKPLKLESEGSTRSSLNNARAIADAGYSFEGATCSFNRQHADYFVTATFVRDNERQTWLFKGLSAGYGGEGPRGLLEFGSIFGIRLDQDKVLNKDYLEKLELLDGKEFRIAQLM